MTMSTVTAADSGAPLPLTGISCPDAGEDIKAEHIRTPVADFLAECNDIRTGTGGLNKMVLKAGDTMTDGLVIGASTSNSRALTATGLGTGTGVRGTGGATGAGVEGFGGATSGIGGSFLGTGNGVGCYGAGDGTGPGVSGLGGTTGNGGEFFAGGTNKHGAFGAGNGTGSGVSCTGGATGPGITATPGTAQTNSAPTCAGRFAGYIQLTGTDPTGATDPGGNNVLHGAVIPKASVTIDNTYAIVERYNIASVTQILGDIWAIAFVRPMANANYGVKIFVHGALGYSGTHNGTKSTTGFQFVLFKTDTLAEGFGIATEAYIEVTGRQ